MNLIIDVGNTRVKVAVFNNSELIHNEIFTSESLLKGVINIVEKYQCRNAIISSVGSVKKSDLIQLKAKINLLELNSETKIPFKNAYATPKTLGVDRIALIASAVLNFPNKNVLVIDAGSCITYDFISSDAVYVGGAISPGLNMRYKAMHNFTKKLPLLEPSESYMLIGGSTIDCMHSGVIFGVLNEIDSAICQYKEKKDDLTVVLTGGDVKFLSNKLKNSIFANPNFLLQGLNKILTHNL